MTELELDDIIKEVFQTLGDKDLHEIIKPFCCKENKILVDYKKFRTYVTNNLQAFKETGQLLPPESA